MKCCLTRAILSAEALRDFGINWVILGHSERRQYYGDDDQIVADKIAKCLSENLNVIACIGETLEERKAEKTMEVVSRQLEAIRRRNFALLVIMVALTTNGFAQLRSTAGRILSLLVGS